MSRKNRAVKHEPKYTLLVELASGPYSVLANTLETFALDVMAKPGHLPWHVSIQPERQMHDLVLEVRNPHNGFDFVELNVTTDPHCRDEDCLAMKIPGEVEPMEASATISRCMMLLITRHPIMTCHEHLSKHLVKLVQGLVGDLDGSYRYCLDYAHGKFLLLTGASPDHDLSFELLVRTLEDKRMETRMANALNNGSAVFVPGGYPGTVGDPVPF